MEYKFILWNCRGPRSNFYELSLLIQRYNPIAVCLQDIFLKKTDDIKIRGFNLYHTFLETDNRASGGVSIIVDGILSWTPDLINFQTKN